jgi:hypothetical protein
LILSLIFLVIGDESISFFLGYVINSKMEYPHSMEEHVAASAVAALAVNGKRDRDDASFFHQNNTNIFSLQNKMPRIQEVHNISVSGPALPPQECSFDNEKKKQFKILKASPYFFYRDFSRMPDADPFTPLTSSGRVPNFPAKMHSILSRPDLSDIVSWVSAPRLFSLFTQTFYFPLVMQA